MLGITRKTDYALVALARLAEADSPRPQSRPISVRRIADQYSLPLPQMMNVFKALQQAGLVRSTRGAQGGYILADRADRIKLLSVIEAIEGPIHLTMCCQEEETDGEPCVSCELIDRCPVTEGTRKLNMNIIALLSQITIRDLMDSHVDVPLNQVTIGPC
ncbi:MAG: Rrf2 family transcriptional regulator [Gammaproteobacteria bacterium]